LQRGCTSWRTGKTDPCSDISTARSMCYRGDIADKPLLRRMWWLASYRR
jgi:hypothetical protein